MAFLLNNSLIPVVKLIVMVNRRVLEMANENNYFLLIKTELMR